MALNALRNHDNTFLTSSIWVDLQIFNIETILKVWTT